MPTHAKNERRHLPGQLVDLSVVACLHSCLLCSMLGLRVQISSLAISGDFIPLLGPVSQRSVLRLSESLLREAIGRVTMVTSMMQKAFLQGTPVSVRAPRSTAAPPRAPLAVSAQSKYADELIQTAVSRPVPTLIAAAAEVVGSGPGALRSTGPISGACVTALVLGQSV